MDLFASDKLHINSRVVIFKPLTDIFISVLDNKNTWSLQRPSETNMWLFQGCSHPRLIAEISLFLLFFVCSCSPPVDLIDLKSRRGGGGGRRGGQTEEEKMKRRRREEEDDTGPSCWQMCWAHCCSAVNREEMRTWRRDQWRVWRAGREEETSGRPDTFCPVCLRFNLSFCLSSMFKLGRFVLFSLSRRE